MKRDNHGRKHDTFADQAHFVAFLVIYAHQDRQLHSFCALPFPMAHALYMQ